MNPVLIIKKKRDGERLSAAEIGFMVEGAASGTVPDYQLSAWLMAVFLKGLDGQERYSLVDAMLHSGEVVDLSGLDGVKVDKHSTGGVGDKPSLVIAPVVAAAGAIVPMVSGRGLGHTGGTLDKLESIPGFRTDIGIDEYKKILKACGFSMIGQTKKIAPADRKLYALRDVTATVDSIPLISASVMSKKIAEGIDALVLDVKTGSGAFMKDYASSKELAIQLVDIGKRAGKRALALITDMSQPLGRMIGNSMEVIESIDVMKGEGPEDIKILCRELSAYMLVLANISSTVEDGRKKYNEMIGSGKALEKFVEMVGLQGGNPKSIYNTDLLPKAKRKFEFKANEDGFVKRVDCELVGLAGVALGGGRRTFTDRVDPSVGMEWSIRIGERIKRGDIIAVIHYNDEARLKAALELLNGVIEVGGRVRPPQLIHEVMKGDS